MNTTKSAIFTQYNKARAAARKGKLPAAETNRALGVLMSATGTQRMAQYLTTTRACTCPARQHNPEKPCKHMVAAMMVQRVNEGRKAHPDVEMQPSSLYVPQAQPSQTVRRSVVKVYWRGTEDALRHADAHTPEDQFAAPADRNAIVALKAAGFSITDLRYLGSRNTPAGYYGRYEVTLEK